MSYRSITRTAPGWEERTVPLLESLARDGSGVSEAVALRPGFARLALLLDGAAAGGTLRVWVQHSADGECWQDLAAFDAVTTADAQVAWVEAQPEIAGSVHSQQDGGLAAGTVHAGFAMSRLRIRWSCATAHLFGVDVVAIYPRAGH